MGAPIWDSGLSLWRAKCSGVTVHPVSGKPRKSPHEAFRFLDRMLLDSGFFPRLQQVRVI